LRCPTNIIKTKFLSKSRSKKPFSFIKFSSSLLLASIAEYIKKRESQKLSGMANSLIMVAI
jgi:hypothetical protein